MPGPGESNSNNGNQQPQQVNQQPQQENPQPQQENPQPQQMNQQPQQMNQQPQQMNQQPQQMNQQPQQMNWQPQQVRWFFSGQQMESIRGNVNAMIHHFSGLTGSFSGDSAQEISLLVNQLRNVQNGMGWVMGNYNPNLGVNDYNRNIQALYSLHTLMQAPVMQAVNKIVPAVRKSSLPIEDQAIIINTIQNFSNMMNNALADINTMERMLRMQNSYFGAGYPVPEGIPNQSSLVNIYMDKIKYMQANEANHTPAQDAPGFPFTMKGNARLVRNLYKASWLMQRIYNNAQVDENIRQEVGAAQGTLFNTYNKLTVRIADFRPNAATQEERNLTKDYLADISRLATDVARTWPELCWKLSGPPYIEADMSHLTTLLYELVKNATKAYNQMEPDSTKKITMPELTENRMPQTSMGVSQDSDFHQIKVRQQLTSQNYIYDRVYGRILHLKQTLSEEWEKTDYSDEKANFSEAIRQCDNWIEEMKKNPAPQTKDGYLSKGLDADALTELAKPLQYAAQISADLRKGPVIWLRNVSDADIRQRLLNRYHHLVDYTDIAVNDLHYINSLLQEQGVKVEQVEPLRTANEDPFPERISNLPPKTVNRGAYDDNKTLLMDAEPVTASYGKRSDETVSEDTVSLGEDTVSLGQSSFAPVVQPVVARLTLQAQEMARQEQYVRDLERMKEKLDGGTDQIGGLLLVGSSSAVINGRLKLYEAAKEFRAQVLDALKALKEPGAIESPEKRAKLCEKIISDSAARMGKANDKNFESAVDGMPYSGDLDAINLHDAFTKLSKEIESIGRDMSGIEAAPDSEMVQKHLQELQKQQPVQQPVQQQPFAQQPPMQQPFAPMQPQSFVQPPMQQAPYGQPPMQQPFAPMQQPFVQQPFVQQPVPQQPMPQPQPVPQQQPVKAPVAEPVKPSFDPRLGSNIHTAADNIGKYLEFLLAGKTSRKIQLEIDLSETSVSGLAKDLANQVNKFRNELNSSDLKKVEKGTAKSKELDAVRHQVVANAGRKLGETLNRMQWELLPQLQNEILPDEVAQINWAMQQLAGVVNTAIDKQIETGAKAPEGGWQLLSSVPSLPDQKQLVQLHEKALQNRQQRMEPFTQTNEKHASEEIVKISFTRKDRDNLLRSLYQTIVALENMKAGISDSPHYDLYSNVLTQMKESLAELTEHAAEFSNAFKVRKYESDHSKYLERISNLFSAAEELPHLISFFESDEQQKQALEEAVNKLGPLVAEARKEYFKLSVKPGPVKVPQPQPQEPKPEVTLESIFESEVLLNLIVDGESVLGDMDTMVSSEDPTYQNLTAASESVSKLLDSVTGGDLQKIIFTDKKFSDTEYSRSALKDLIDNVPTVAENMEKLLPKVPAEKKETFEWIIQSLKTLGEQAKEEFNELFPEAKKTEAENKTEETEIQESSQHEKADEVSDKQSEEPEGSLDQNSEEVRQEDTDETVNMEEEEPVEHIEEESVKPNEDEPTQRIGEEPAKLNEEERKALNSEIAGITTRRATELADLHLGDGQSLVAAQALFAQAQLAKALTDPNTTDAQLNELVATVAVTSSRWSNYKDINHPNSLDEPEMLEYFNDAKVRNGHIEQFKESDMLEPFKKLIKESKPVELMKNGEAGIMALMKKAHEKSLEKPTHITGGSQPHQDKPAKGFSAGHK